MFHGCVIIYKISQSILFAANEYTKVLVVFPSIYDVKAVAFIPSG